MVRLRVIGCLSFLGLGACGYLDYEVVPDETTDPEPFVEVDATTAPAPTAAASENDTILETPPAGGIDAVTRVLTARRMASHVTLMGATLCVRASDNTMHCTGSNWLGKRLEPAGGIWGDIGTETAANVTPSQLGAGFVIAALFSIDNEACATNDLGGMKCWGGNWGGELGLGNTDTLGDEASETGDGLPFVFPNGSGVVSGDMGLSNTCIVFEDGGLRCYGEGTFGQLGNGATDTLGDDPGEEATVLPNIDLGDGVAVQWVAVGDTAVCALTTEGRVKCWGEASDGRLLNGSSTGRLGDDPGEMGSALPFLDLGSDFTAVDIAAGSAHFCALNDAGRVKCWGDNQSGRLGLGDTMDRGGNASDLGDGLPYVNLGTDGTTGEPLRAEQLVAGSNFACALIEGARVKCWGDNSHGRLGLGDDADRGDDPAEMGDSLPFVNLGSGFVPVSLSAGQRATCAISDLGRVKCWGRNLDGMFGTGDGSDVGLTPESMGDGLVETPLPFDL